MFVCVYFLNLTLWHIACQAPYLGIEFVKSWENV